MRRHRSRGVFRIRFTGSPAEWLACGGGRCGTSSSGATGSVLWYPQSGYSEQMCLTWRYKLQVGFKKDTTLRATAVGSLVDLLEDLILVDLFIFVRWMHLGKRPGSQHREKTKPWTPIADRCSTRATSRRGTYKYCLMRPVEMATECLEFFL